MGRQSNKEKFLIERSNAMLSTRSGAPFLEDSRFKSKKLLGTRLNLKVPVEINTKATRLKLIGCHEDLVQLIQGQAYMPMFDHIRKDTALKDRFQSLWKGVLRDVYNGKDTEEAVFVFHSIIPSKTDTPIPTSKAGKYLLADVFRSSLSRTVMGKIARKFPASHLLPPLLEELIQTGRATIGKAGMERKPCFEAYLNTLASPESLHQRIMDLINQVAQIWRGLDSFLGYCKQNNLTELDQPTYNTIENWLRFIGAETTARTQRDYLRAVRQAYDFASLNRLTKWANPCADIQITPTALDTANESKNYAEELKGKVVPPDELVTTIKYLAASCEGRWKKERQEIYYSVLTLLTLGLRGSEISKLQPKFRDLNRTVIIEGTKRSKSRRVAQNVGQTTFLLLTEHTKFLVANADRITQHLDRLHDEKKIPRKITAHMLRHSFVTYEIYCSDRSDEAYRRVQDCTGHTRAEIQAIYNDPAALYDADYGSNYINNIWFWVKHHCLIFPEKTDFETNFMTDV